MQMEDGIYTNSIMEDLLGTSGLCFKSSNRLGEGKIFLHKY